MNATHQDADLRRLAEQARTGPWKAQRFLKGDRGLEAAMSAAETLLAVQLDQAKIAYVREFRFASPRRWRADFALAYPADWLYMVNRDGVTFRTQAIRILVEIDGGGYVAGRHTRGAGFEKDCEKASAAAILGYRVIRCTPRQVEDGSALSWIRQALGLEVAA